MRAGFILAVCLLVMAGIFPQSAFTASYNVTDLGMLPGGWQIQPQRLNNSGAAVGWCLISADDGDYYRGFLWRNGSMTDTGTFGGSNSWAYGINDSGDVVGSAETPDYYFDEYGFLRNCSHAFLWRNGANTDLGTLGGNNSWAYAVNSSRYVVGWSETGLVDADGHPVNHAFIWLNGVMLDLNDSIISGSGWEFTSASGITESGMIIGAGVHSGAASAFICDFITGSLTEIPALAGNPVYPYSVNTASTAVGGTYTQAYPFTSTAFIWDSARGTRALGLLPGFAYSQANSINNAGQIVGRMTSADQMTDTAVLWYSGGVSDLNPLLSPSYNLNNALSINAYGQVLASGAGGAYLLSPVPQSAVNVKKSADGLSAKLQGITVTAAFADEFYVEDDNRACGLSVHKASHDLSAGMRADVTGVLKTDSNGERYIEAASAYQNGAGTLNLLALNNRALGGGNWLLNPTTSAGQAGVKDGVGLNNIGLLIRTCGKLIQNSDGSFSIDDGSGISPKLQIPPGLTIPSPGQNVIITGISSCRKDTAGAIHSQIKLRSTDGAREIVD